MKILFDENMPFAREFFENFGAKENELVSFKGRELTAEQLIDADVLLVRSITQVNEQLLNDARKLKFVGTATIGVDHIDRAYLASRNIAFSSSPGCNAISVAEYVVSALVVLAEKYLFALTDKTIGIIGAGNTGTRLSEKLEALGVNYKLCDPLLNDAGDNRAFSTLEEALACDVISLHVPLTREGSNPTYHLLNDERITALSDEQIVINACRGEVIDNKALLSFKRQGAATRLVLDVWENEPNILSELIPFTELSTAHIAGYSLEGKARGTEMLYQALAKVFDFKVEKSLSQFLPKPSINRIKINQDFDEILLNQVVKMVYDVRRDDAIFRQQLSRFGFDHIRKTYPARREFSSVAIASENTELNSLFQLGFERLCKIEEEQ
ncbi:4-phosphoerythronate dehydrogenase [Thalassotalea sp. M1531]|uniref:Erythronate-4-phosphate dehydrogenase n=1 Tax=Thalassotalea algicola TaxID=2716224 RepID=A0A7Y0Q7P5_9GAMM|nr:4-phosphoerythronate dehydrogenase [Thalassotalea algicola]NMP31250.1 4-phosphoerythronate dehydrogenase [Thalassotalea algicola]